MAQKLAEPPRQTAEEVLELGLAQSEQLPSGTVATVDPLEDIPPGVYACVPIPVLEEILQYLQTDQWCKVNRIMMGLQGVPVLKIEEPNGEAQEAEEAS